LPTPTKVGHTFLGWVEKGGNAVPNPNYTIPVGTTGNKTFVAKWSANKYELDINGRLDNGSIESNIKGMGTLEVYVDGVLANTENANDYCRDIAYGSQVEIKNIKAYEGKTFKGSSHSLKFTMEKPVKITLDFKTNEYTYRFDPNGGTGTGSDIKLKHGETLSIPKLFKRDFYTQTCWTRSADGSGTKYDVGGKYSGYSGKDGDIVTLYAQWRPNKATIYYHANGAKMNTSMAGSHYGVDTDGYVTTSNGERLSFTADYGSYVAGSSTDSVPDVQCKGAVYLEKQGYHYNRLEAWNTNPDGTGRSVQENRGYLAEELVNIRNGDNTDTFYANWKKSSYTLTYNANGGTVGTSSKTLEYGDAFGTLPTPKRDGHKFLGWYTSATGGTKVSEATKIGAENTTIYAHWDAYTLSINYHADGAEYFRDYDLINNKELGTVNVAGKDIVKVQTVKYGSKLPDYGVLDGNRFTKTGYTADSPVVILKDGTSLSVTEPYTAIELATKAGKQEAFKTEDVSIDIYPKWVINKYSNKVDHWAVGFRNQEGNNGGDKNAYKINTTYFDAVFNTTFIMDGSKHATLPNGFYLHNMFGTSAIDGTWQTYPLGTKVTQGAKSLGFEYYYYPITYKIAYNLNGGTNSSDNPSSYNVLYGVSLKNPTRQGYTFSGWYNGDTKVTGINEGKGANFASSAELYSELEKRTIGDVTLEARWTPTKYTLSFDPNGGTVNPTSKTVSYGSPYGDLPTPTKSGNTFLGWYTEKDGGTKVSSTTIMGSSNVTLYAHWQLDIRDTVIGNSSILANTIGQYVRNNDYIYSIKVGTSGSGSLEATYDVSQNQDNSVKARVYRQDSKYCTISITPETGYRMIAPDNCHRWFAWDGTDTSRTRIQSISISSVDFKNTRDMSLMFEYCGIRDVTLKGIDNKDIVTSGMFEGCDNLQSITVDSLWGFNFATGLQGVWTDGSNIYGNLTLPSYRDATYRKDTGYVYLEAGFILNTELLNLISSYPSKIAIEFGTPSGGLFGSDIDVSENQDGSVLMNWGYSGGSMSSGVIYIYPSDSTKKIALNSKSRGMFDGFYNNEPITVDFGTGVVTDVLTRNTPYSLVWHTSSDLSYTGDDICGLVSNVNNRSIQLQSDNAVNVQGTSPDTYTSINTPDLLDESVDNNTQTIESDVQEDTNIEVTDLHDEIQEESNQTGY